jgi:hypothetical protein
VVKNKGGHAGFWVLPVSEKDNSLKFMPQSYDNPEEVKIGPFTIFPNKFFLKKGDTIKLDIKFDPSDEGKFCESFLLGCDNLKTYEFTIRAEANMIELRPNAVNGFVLTPECHPFKELDFRDVDFRNPVQKTFEIENLTKNKITYEWRKKDTNSEFVIEAAEGEFSEREKKKFNVTYKAQNLEASYAEIELIIKNIPLESVKNPPPHIQEMIRKNAELSASQRHSQQVEFVYFTFRLFGEVNQLKYNISPEFFESPVLLPLEQKQYARFSIKNHNKSSSTFSITQDSISNPAFQTRLIGVFRSVPVKVEPESPTDPNDKKKKRASNKLAVSYGVKRNSSQKAELKVEAKVEEFPHPEPGFEYIEIPRPSNGYYPIEQLEELDFYIEFKCSIPLNKVQSTYVINYTNSYSTSVDVIASFEGTKLRICASDVYFGVVKSFSTDEREFEIENYSDVDAEVLVRCQKHKSLDLEMYKQSVEENDINNLNYLFNNGPFIITPLYQVIRANSKGRVNVKLVTEDAGLYDENIEVIPTLAEKRVVRALADVQDVHVCLNRYFIEYQQIYASKVYSIEREPQVIKLRNLGNIASNFKWIVPNNQDVMNAMIDPMEGTIQPKSEINIRIKFAIKLFGKFTFYFKCELDNIDLPLGFELTASVFGLNIAYENMPVVDELALSRKKALKKMQKNLGATDKSLGASRISGFSGTHNNLTGGGLSSGSQAAEVVPSGTPLKQFDFMNLNINEPFSFQFKIKNLSGIPTNYRLSFANYDASSFKVEKLPQAESVAGDSSPANKEMDLSFSKHKTMSKNFSINSDTIKTKNNSALANKRLKLLNDNVEMTHVFYSENGMKATQIKYAQKEAEEYLKNGKGVALVCDPVKGSLAANSEAVITVKVYNELSGVFTDKLMCDIKGLETAVFPVTMVIRGSPLKIPTDQVGLKINHDPPILDFGGKLKDGKALEKTLKLSNIGTQPMIVVLKIFNIDDLDPKRDQFRMKFTSGMPGTGSIVGVKWEPIEPPFTDQEPFTLEEYQLTIPPKSVVPVKIKYDSNEIREYNSVVTITPRFEKEHNAELDLGLLSVLLKSKTMNPQLTLQERPNLNGDWLFKFHKYSVGRAGIQTRSILLLNELPCHLYFKCIIEGPFSFLGNTSGAEDFSQERIEELIAKNESYLAKNTMNTKVMKKLKELEGLDIVEGSNVGLLLNFEGYDAQDFERWPNTRLNFVGGVLKVIFRNGQTQDIKLEGWLYRPFLFMNSTGFEPCHDPMDPPTMDFGMIHIDDETTQHIWLCNKSPVPAQWKIVYVPFPQKDYYGACTTTKLEKENLEKVDDPEVFSFDISEVKGWLTVGI